MFEKTVITGGAPGPHLLVTGGVHGDEFEPMEAIRRLMRAVSPERLRGKLSLVPVVNEAAFLRGGRVAEDELDLARICPGRADGSPTERAAHAVSELIRSADYYIDLHTGGTKLAVLPLVGYTLHSDATVLDAQRRMARAFNLPIVWGTTPNLNGRTLSVAREALVPAIYAEWRGAAVCDPQGVQAYVAGCLNVMGALAMIDRPAPAPRVQHVVEDAREQSGHMQICNRAPMTGFLQMAVELGQQVLPGDLLATISDPLGERVQRVVSRQEGIVLTLHTFGRILEGESVAVVLETSRESK